MNERQSWIRFLPSQVVLNIASVGPCGHARKAPGTVGSLAGLIWYTVVFYPLGNFNYLLMLALTIYLAVEFCGEAEKRLFQRDPSQVVLDEFVAMPVCFIGLQPYLEMGYAWAIFIVGFGLFRFFDIIKPLGIKRLQDYPGGVGIVVDDLAAGLAACLTLHAILWGLTAM